MAGFLGSGTLYFNRVVAGVEQGWLPFGNATKFSIKENSEKKERPLKLRGQYGQIGDSVFIKKPAEISIALDDINKDNLALAFMGDLSTVSVSGSTVTDEAVTGNHDKIFKTAQRKISSIVITDAATDLTTYVLDTDYEIVNADLGLIKVLSTGSITDGEALHVDYTYGSVAGNKVAGGTNSSIKVALLLDGQNFADDSNVVVNVWESVLSPTSEVDFLADDFNTIELAGTLNTPTTKTSPYEVETDVVYT